MVSDVAATEKQIDENTVMIAGSAFEYSYGIQDKIEELAELALRYNIGFHVDCCLGGLFLPFVNMIEPGYASPFDF